jgi:phenylpropionate dioxygenase-like ring-hydroxylating dioxygenase large terminal subunit
VLSREDNELLTRIGPGTPMGSFMRQYWLPLLQSEDLQADGPPVRMKHLGEDLVAFRDTSGQVGLLAEHCPHRGASLFFGRNEEAALRCVYHGWKFDVDGNCVDMPNEPAESDFKHRVKAVAYTCRERNGVIWAYLGPRAKAPPLPEFEGHLVPETHRYVARSMRECNWLQAIEGDVDSSHISFLHSTFGPVTFASKDFEYRHRDKQPVFRVQATDYGAIYGARRTVDEASFHWRLAMYLFPTHVIIPPNYPNRLQLISWQPLDDCHTMWWGLTWDPTGPLPEEVRRRKMPGVLPGFGHDEHLTRNEPSDPLRRWLPAGNRDNDYLIDYQAQKTIRYSGVPTFHLQDKAITESMGAVADRSAEHLVASDAMVIQIRRRMLGALKAFTEVGQTPPGVDEPEWYRLRTAAVVLPKDEDWLEGTAEYLKAFSDQPVAFPA